MSRMDDLLSEGWRRREAARLEFARLQVAAEGDLESSLARANAIASEVLHVERVGVWLFDWSANALRCISLRDRGAAQPANLPALRIADLGAYSRALRERRAVAAYAKGDMEAALGNFVNRVSIGLGLMADF